MKQPFKKEYVNGKKLGERVVLLEIMKVKTKTANKGKTVIFFIIHVILSAKVFYI